FLNGNLPESLTSIIDFSSLKPQKDTFVNKDLEESFSDLLFKANIRGETGYFYFLFEHKSYPSKGIVIQLLKYMSEIWEAKTLKEKEWNLPVIIPLVIYHGKKNWNMAKSVGDMIKGYATLSSDVQKFIPNFEYLLY